MYLVMVTSAAQAAPAATPKPQPAAPAPSVSSAPAAPSGMTATASSSDKKNPPEMAIDGNPKTHWSSERKKEAQWLKIDLGKTWNLTGYAVDWHHGEKQTYQYLIEVSDDDKTYQVSVDQQANATPGNTNDTIAAGKANRGRYIRLTIKEGVHPEIDEFHINGTPAAGTK